MQAHRGAGAPPGGDRADCLRGGATQLAGSRGACVKAIELYRRGQGWLPASDEAIAVRNRMEQGELAWFRPLRVRCPKELRRYWALMTMCADNCERIEMPYGGVMLVQSKDDVHDAVKICAGHCTTIFDTSGTPVYQIPKSISYEDMTEDEWLEFWPRVTDVVMERVLPGVSSADIELELLKCMRLAA